MKQLRLLPHGIRARQRRKLMPGEGVVVQQQSVAAIGKEAEFFNNDVDVRRVE